VPSPLKWGLILTLDFITESEAEMIKNLHELRDPKWLKGGGFK
jgi:hypothetical protein